MPHTISRNAASDTAEPIASRDRSCPYPANSRPAGPVQHALASGNADRGRQGMPKTTAALKSSACFRMGPAARFKYGLAGIDRYADMLSQCDPLADQLVALFARMQPGEGYSLLRKALDEGIESVPQAPPELREFFASIDSVPGWVNWDQLDHGGAMFLRSGAAGVLALALSSLPLSYSSPAGNKPLTMSGRLEARSMRRLGETGQYVYLVSLPGGLRRFSDGFKATIKVRIMHAQVRAFTRRDGRWRDDLWGAPINQCYMAATVLLFSKGLLQAMERFGLTFDPKEREALIQLWRYASYLLGVMPELQCENEAATERLAEMVFDLDGPPDEDARALVAALMDVPRQMGMGHCEWARRLSFGMSEGLIGRERARSLGYPMTLWRLLVPLMRPAVRTADAIRRFIPGIDRLLNGFGRMAWRFVIEHTLGAGQESGESSGCPFHAAPKPRRSVRSSPFDFFTVEIHRRDRQAAMANGLDPNS